ncbi:Endonuclease/Exonuclease/phosphatase family protein [Arenibacter nanhaiticus]|uniref:Endonuclease/Exonuclease/phosphatase family protein n=1 Tax=Arenibacter nanhaiticus TaxID=558155 RepID=A0A1M6AAK8_9FLAO|nr:endonuclease/exonuclease/phosphatase family protein [Arenibacter nanhaiticus]SHI33512.1 Endonuclease/Exonuclease/phosphatase family protein [Arenibacter nanhaiticus]
MNFSFFKRKKAITLHTIAFYNVENLFDPLENEGTLDADFTPKGVKRWTTHRYKRKLQQLAATISEIGLSASGCPPDLVGVAEVENKLVLQELLATGPLKKVPYDFVHYDSADERGIDTALLYNKEIFKVVSSQAIPLVLDGSNGLPESTRDILYVSGKLKGEPMHLFVNHWPSKRDGTLATEYKRIIAANTITGFMRGIQKEYPNANYVVMGDFNDDPSSLSIQTLKRSHSLYNPIEKLQTPTRGSVNYQKSWCLFDQILLSPNFLTDTKGTLTLAGADIFDEGHLKESKGKYKGSPFRTYVGSRYLGGISDHFPVYIQLELK